MGECLFQLYDRELLERLGADGLPVQVGKVAKSEKLKCEVCRAECWASKVTRFSRKGGKARTWTVMALNYKGLDNCKEPS